MLRALHQEVGLSCAELARRYPQYAARSIYRHATSDRYIPIDARRANPGRPRILSLRDERLIIRTLHRLRSERASFSVRKIQEETGLHVSFKTIYRVLRKHGYRYRQSRKKGLLSKNDLQKRLKFARLMKSMPLDFWTKDITFYFDGVGFAHRCNPYAEARAVSSMAWRKPREGLSITTKGRKEGSNGKMANFFVAISHGRGVVLCKQHDWRITGEHFAQFIKDNFPGKKKRLIFFVSFHAFLKSEWSYHLYII